MAMLFQNTTKISQEVGRTSYEDFHSANDISRTKNRFRMSIAVGTGAALFLIYSVKTYSQGRHMGYAGHYVYMFIFLAIGLVIGEVATRMKYGNVVGADKNAQPAVREIKYSFMDDKILITENYNSDAVFYNQISKVTHDQNYFYIYTGAQKLYISKYGFNVNPAEFEKLMNSYGYTLGVEYGQY